MSAYELLKMGPFELLSEYHHILVICPCCKALFRLAECKVGTPASKSAADRFSLMQEELRKIEVLEFRIEQEAEKLGEYEEDMKERLAMSKKVAREAGRKEAKERLKKIDPVFSGKDIDPQDVRVLFHPVDYIVFSKMSSETGMDKIEMVSREPYDKTEEVICDSIGKVVQKGNIEFQVITVAEDGSLTCGTEAGKPKGRKFKVTI